MLVNLFLSSVIKVYLYLLLWKINLFNKDLNKGKLSGFFCLLFPLSLSAYGNKKKNENLK